MTDEIMHSLGDCGRKIARVFVQFISGAGIGGIAAAARLAQRGLRVTVIEKNSRPGGRCDRMSREGHHFDTGPTLLVMPLLYDAEFAAPVNGHTSWDSSAESNHQ